MDDDLWPDLQLDAPPVRPVAPRPAEPVVHLVLAAEAPPATTPAGPTAAMYPDDLDSVAGRPPRSRGRRYASGPVVRGAGGSGPDGDAAVPLRRLSMWTPRPRVRRRGFASPKEFMLAILFTVVILIITAVAAKALARHVRPETDLAPVVTHAAAPAA